MYEPPLADEEAAELGERLLSWEKTPSKVYEIVMRFNAERRGLLPDKMSTTLLSEVLRDMGERVKSGDSWEGSIEYLLPAYGPGDEDIDGDLREVRASYRIGNDMGQGGVRLIGTVRGVEPSN